MLIKLHELGCVLYIGWQRNFLFHENEIVHLEDEQKYMSQQLQLWSEAVDAARNECYVLNSFTMKQLLQLCKKLRPQFTGGDVSFSIDEQTCSLLKCMHPCIDTKTMQEILKKTWQCMEADLHVEPQDSLPPVPVDFHDETTEEAQLDFLIERSQSTFTDQQQSMYIELVETHGLNPLWMIAEILSRKYSSATEILMQTAELLEDGNEPTNDELLKSIRNNLQDAALPPILTNSTSSEARVEVIEKDHSYSEM